MLGGGSAEGEVAELWAGASEKALALRREAESGVGAATGARVAFLHPPSTVSTSSLWLMEHVGGPGPGNAQGAELYRRVARARGVLCGRQGGACLALYYALCQYCDAPVLTAAVPVPVLARGTDRRAVLRYCASE